MGLDRYRFWGALCVLAASAVLVGWGVGHAAYRKTFGTELKVTQVRVSKESEPGVDPRIPKGMLRALKRRFGSEYKSYTVAATEVREAKLGKDERFDLKKGGVLTVRVVGYNPSKRIVDLKIQTEQWIIARSLERGAYWVGYIVGADDPDEPLAIVIRARLLQIVRP